MNQGMFKVGDWVRRTEWGDGIQTGHIAKVTEIGRDRLSSNIRIAGSDTWWATKYFEHAKNKIVTDILNDL